MLISGVRQILLILIVSFGFTYARAQDSGVTDWAGLANDPTLQGYHQYEGCGVYSAALSGKIMRLTHQQARRVFLHFHKLTPGGTTLYHVFVTYHSEDRLWVADNAGSRGSWPLDTPVEKWVKDIVPDTDDYDIIEERDFPAYRRAHPGP